MSEILTLDGEITGNIVPVHSIEGNISHAISLQGGISNGSLLREHPFYEGVYNVTPVADLDILLETSGKLLRDNIIVN